MYLLDTNVISELRKSARATPSVVRWSESISSAEQYLSAMTIFEVELGILKIGRTDEAQAGRLRAWLNNQILPAFSGRILPIDENVALNFARIMTPKTRPYRDALIASTAEYHGYTIVTRNVRDFAELPVKLINPWDFA
jgi:predicted nucleic acid-binding protein